jgi:hypothetical protein
VRLAVLQPAGSPVAQQHYRDTIANPVMISVYADDLGSDYEVLKALHPAGTARLWGATPGQGDANVKAYARMSPGDYVFFAGSGRLFAGATVTHTLRNAVVAQQLWGRDDKDQTWELMFALDELRAFEIPYAEMNRVVGYNETNIVQGFTVLNDDRSAALFDFLELDSDLHPAAPTRSELQAMIANLPAGTDAAVSSLRRLEQGLLRRTLLPRAEGLCDICGDELPVQFLVAAHIKKRSACSVAERLDIPSVAMVACKFGCDALFEEGYIAVDESGSIVVSPLAPRADAAGRYLQRLDGRKVAVAAGARLSYFSWHLNHTYRASR